MNGSYSVIAKNHARVLILGSKYKANRKKYFYFFKNSTHHPQGPPNTQKCLMKKIDLE